MVCKQLLPLTLPHPGWPLGQGDMGTHLTSEGLLPRVLQRVHLERHAAFEGLPTGLAGEGHVLGVGYEVGTMAVTALGDPTCPGACLTASVPGLGAAAQADPFPCGLDRFLSALKSGQASVEALL